MRLHRLEDREEVSKKWSYIDVLGAVEGDGEAGSHPRS